MVSLKDESTQRHGMVAVLIGQPNGCIRPLAPKLKVFETALPSRLVAMHVCVLEDTLNPLVRFFLKALGKETRLRFRIHLEGKYDLILQV